MRTIFAGLLIVMAATIAFADGYETEAKRIEGLLITPCCWGSTVAEHNSPEALEVKAGIREMLQEGKSEPAILAFYEEKFGERILARPKAEGFNLLAWGLPAVGFLIGAIAAVLFIRRWHGGEKKEEESPSVAAADEKYSKQIDEELYGSQDS